MGMSTSLEAMSDDEVRSALNLRDVEFDAAAQRGELQELLKRHWDPSDQRPKSDKQEAAPDLKDLPNQLPAKLPVEEKEAYVSDLAQKVEQAGIGIKVMT